MAPLWSAVRRRLERYGAENRGRVRTPVLDAAGRLTVKSLLGRPSAPALIDLAELEASLVRLGVGADLPGALAALGFGISEAGALRRAARARGSAARQAARDSAAAWPEPWAEAWVDGVIRAGLLRDLDAGGAVETVGDVRRVLDEIERRSREGSGPIARVDLAAQVLGDAHRLDSGRRLEAAVSRALALRTEQRDPDRAAWAWTSAGVDLDLTSGPVLTWRLPAVGGLAPVVDAATTAGIPVHLSRMALRTHPIRIRDGAEVLVVENPRIVEAAAQQRVERAVVSAGGSPSGAVQLLVHQLLDAGAVVLYHGDFDSAGLTLCARMAARGVRPWRMTAADYLDALGSAAREGVRLPTEPRRPPRTPWDPQLSEELDRRRLVVHEERLLPALLKS